MERMALRVGEVATRAGVHRETLRYYERRGLITSPPRNTGYSSNRVTSRPQSIRSR